jgi:hypothetical protein
MCEVNVGISMFYAPLLLLSLIKMASPESITSSASGVCQVTFDSLPQQKNRRYEIGFPGVCISLLLSRI